MGVDASQLLIGYSVFDTVEECYSYNENACFIASTPDAAQRFLEVACDVPGDARVMVIHWPDLLMDFGCPGGEYALESDAFSRFQTLANEHGVAFEAQAYDGDDSLMVVEIERRFLTPVPE